MKKGVETCCTSPAAMCFWFGVSLAAWGVLSFIGMYWHPLHASSAVGILFAMAIGCFANWARHHSFHCAITGPLFLVAGAIFLMSDVRIIQVDTLWVWSFLLIGVAVAFLLEWHYAKRGGDSLLTHNHR